jgi:hypothetical protein
MPVKVSTDLPEPQPKIGLPTLIIIRLQRFARDIAGVIMLAASLMTLLALLIPDLTGDLLRWWIGILRVWFGWGSGWVVIMGGAAGMLMLRRPAGDWPRSPWKSVIALEVAAFTTLACLAALGGASLERADAGLDGGRIGWALFLPLGKAVSPLGLVGEIIGIGWENGYAGRRDLLYLKAWVTWLMRALRPSNQDCHLPSPHVRKHRYCRPNIEKSFACLPLKI